MIRFSCLGAFLVAFALAGPASAAGGCGVGCHSTSEGRDRFKSGCTSSIAGPIGDRGRKEELAGCGRAHVPNGQTLLPSVADARSL